jgi:hypothetical protein
MNICATCNNGVVQRQRRDGFVGLMHRLTCQIPYKCNRCHHVTTLPHFELLPIAILGIAATVFAMKTSFRPRWKEQPVRACLEGNIATNQSVVELLGLGFQPSTILQNIRHRPHHFVVDDRRMRDLRIQGVPDPLVEAMGELSATNISLATPVCPDPSADHGLGLTARNTH